MIDEDGGIKDRRRNVAAVANLLVTCDIIKLKDLYPRPARPPHSALSQLHVIQTFMCTLKTSNSNGTRRQR